MSRARSTRRQVQPGRPTPARDLSAPRGVLRSDRGRQMTPRCRRSELRAYPSSSLSSLNVAVGVVWPPYAARTSFSDWGGQITPRRPRSELRTAGSIPARSTWRQVWSGWVAGAGTRHSQRQKSFMSDWQKITPLSTMGNEVPRTYLEHPAHNGRREMKSGQPRRWTPFGGWEAGQHAVDAGVARGVFHRGKPPAGMGVAAIPHVKSRDAGR